jgi:OmpA-OmpF porin, OOP family
VHQECRPLNFDHLLAIRVVASPLAKDTHTVPMLRPSLVVAALAGSISLAQSGDEWNTFPPKPAPTAAPAPAPRETPSVPARPPPGALAPTTAPQPQPAPAPASSPRPPSRAAEAAPLDTAVRPDAGLGAFAETEGADGGEYQVVGQRERFLAGTEPHSPSTWLAAWDAPENARVSVGQAGLGSGFVPTARLGQKGLVRVSFFGEYLSISPFPVQGSQDIRSAATFAASFQPFTWGEVFVAYSATANSNSTTAPNLLQALGDLTLGVKVSREWVRGLWAGGDVRLLTFSGVGNQGLDRYAVGFRPTLVGTFDFRTLSRYVPVLFTVNLGFTLDSTGGLVANQVLNASEEFALGINRYHRFNFALAAEVPLPFVSPFFEYAFGLPLGVGSLTGPDGVAVAPTAAMAQTFNVGLKITAVKDLTLLTGFNFGLARSVGLGVPATPPWNFWFGASFAIDPFQRGDTRFVETLRERKGASASRLEGVLTDAQTRAAVAGALIEVPGVKPSASDQAGAYQTLELPGPKVAVTVTRDGYAPVQREVTLDPAHPTRLDLALDPDARKARFELSVKSDKKPVKATVSFAGTAEAKVETAEAATGPATTELPSGHYTITASADGFLAQVREVQVTAGATLPVAFELVPAPKKMLVVLRGDRIEIAQQVHFATGKATILADSYNLLQQVADVVIKSGVKKIRVEGHTDNRGDKAANQALSEARARSVAEYLVSQGFEPGRIESQGYGDSRPVAPNLTARGRELNRRVEFIVVEK